LNIVDSMLGQVTKVPLTVRVGEFGDRGAVDVPCAMWDERPCMPSGRRLDEVDMSVTSVPVSAVGLVVEYLTDVCCGCPVDEAFGVSIAGAVALDAAYDTSAYTDRLRYMLSNIHVLGMDIDETSVRCAFSAVSMDVAYKQGVQAYNGMRDPRNVDDAAIDVVRRLCRRGVAWLCPPTGEFACRSFSNTYELFDSPWSRYVGHGHADMVVRSDTWGRFGDSRRALGDSLAICDFKCTKTARPGIQAREQVIGYWLLGLICEIDAGAVGQSLNSRIDKVCIWNPRFATSWWLDLSKVDRQRLLDYAVRVIGYPSDDDSLAILDHAMSEAIGEGCRCH
jgi:hypothetical protein